MAKFAVKTKAPKIASVTIAAPKGVIKTKSATPTTVTYEGAAGFERKAKSELFLLAVTNLVSESTFYESGKARDERFVELIHKVVAKDPAWVASFVPYLRDTLNMRTASIVMAAEYVKGGGPNGRKVIASALSRAEEPSVLIGYWHKFYGKNLPQPVKRGVADAVQRLYNEKSVIKWDSDSLSPRFGDVIEMTHAKGQAPWQHDLFRYAIDKRHNREDLSRNTESLSVIRAYRALMAMPVGERRPLLDKAIESGDLSPFEGAGLTWENLSGWLQGPMDAAAWQLVIPQMQYMATLRNLRNFDEASISAEAQAAVIAKLTDPEEVKASRQLPMRFYTAYKNVTSAHYVSALETALDMTLANIPSLKGRTLVLVDTSGSMSGPFSGGNTRSWQHSGEAKTSTLWEMAALFGSAIAIRAEHADLAYFQSDSGKIDFKRNASILRTIEAFKPHVGGGTNGHQALARHFDGHDRVVYVTDEQFHPGGRMDVKSKMYVFNVAGYRTAAFSSNDGVYSFGGLSDKAFAAIEAIENFKGETWPWDKKS